MERYVFCFQSDATGKGRKKIHRIMKDENVGEATRRAAREEEERKKRISEKQKLVSLGSGICCVDTEEG